MASNSVCSIPPCQLPCIAGHLYCETHSNDLSKNGYYGFRIFAMAGNDLIENSRTQVVCSMEPTDTYAPCDLIEQDRSQLSDSKEPTWNVGFTFPAIGIDRRYNIILAVITKEGKFLGRVVFSEHVCKTIAQNFDIPSIKMNGQSITNEKDFFVRGVHSTWEPLSSRVISGQTEPPSVGKWQLGFMHYIIAPVGTQIEHFTSAQLKPSLSEIRATIAKVALVADNKKVAISAANEGNSNSENASTISGNGIDIGEEVPPSPSGMSLRTRRQQSTQQVVERASLPDRIGHADVVEIEKLLDKGGSGQKQVLAILEKAALSPDRLNAIYHMIDIKRLIGSMNEGFVFKARSALLQSFCLCLPILDFRAKHRICEELWARNKEGVELETLDIILLSLDRVSLESTALAAPWLKAHQRVAYAINLSDKLLHTGVTGTLVQPGKATDACKTIDHVTNFVLSLIPNKGVGLRLEEHEYFNEYCLLLGLDEHFRSRLDIAGHKKQYVDANAFICAVARGMKLNPIVVAFLDEWEKQPTSVKSRAFPQQTKARDRDIVRAIVYCFFLDLVTHSVMFEKPADVAPLLEEEETLIEMLTRLTAARFHQSEWWKYFDFSEHLQHAAINHDWEVEMLPFKRQNFAETRSEEQKHKGEIMKFKIYETMFGDLLRESDTETGFALVRGTMQKGTNALFVPDLGIFPWKESFLQPKGKRAVEGEAACRMGFGAEPEALSPVWENLFMSWRLRACFCESDGIMMLAKLLTPVVGTFYQTKEGNGHFLTMRLATKYIHWRFEGLTRAQRKKKEPDMDWRAPHFAALWAKVNRWSAGQYLTKLDAIIQKQESKTAEVLKAIAAADLNAWGKMQAGFKKHGHTHNAHAENWNEQMTRLFWKICSKNHPDAAMLGYEQEVFRRGERQFTGATHKTWLPEAEEKMLVRRTKEGLIDPTFYNAKLKELRTPLIEDLLFDRKGIRSEALGNQARIGTLLIEIKNIQLEHHHHPLHCVVETTLTPRDGRFQGSVHTSESHDGKWNESFLLPLSSRVFPSGFSLVVEVWHHKDLLGVANFSMDDLKQYEVSCLTEDAKTEVFSILSARSNYSADTKMNLEQCDYISIGDIEMSIQATFGQTDPLCDYNKYQRISDAITHRAWPASHSAAKIPHGHRTILRSTVNTLAPAMKTGDLILWASSLDHGDLPTRLMNTAMNGITHSIYTHAAIVYVAVHPITKERFVLHVESGVNRLLNLDSISRTPFGNSIFVTDLAERVENDGYTMVYKSLLEPLSPEGIEHISRFISHLWLRDPPFASAQLVAAGLEKTHLKLTENTEDWNQLFCSELVSACFKLAGVKEFQHLNTSTLSPADVAAQPIYKKRNVLRLLDEHGRRASFVMDFQATAEFVRQNTQLLSPASALVRQDTLRQLEGHLDEDAEDSPFLTLKRQDTTRKLEDQFENAYAEVSESQ